MRIGHQWKRVPELQPAEHLWPLTNTVLINRHFASIEELENAQAERCVALQECRDLIRSATCFSLFLPVSRSGRCGSSSARDRERRLTTAKTMHEQPPEHLCEATPPMSTAHDLPILHISYHRQLSRRPYTRRR